MDLLSKCFICNGTGVQKTFPTCGECHGNKWVVAGQGQDRTDNVEVLRQILKDWDQDIQDEVGSEVMGIRSK